MQHPVENCESRPLRVASTSVFFGTLFFSIRRQEDQSVDKFLSCTIRACKGKSADENCIFFAASSDLPPVVRETRVNFSSVANRLQTQKTKEKQLVRLASDAALRDDAGPCEFIPHVSVASFLGFEWSPSNLVLQSFSNPKGSERRLDTCMQLCPKAYCLS